jgi:hypothetical protein
VTAVPSPAVAVTAQLCNLFCDGDYDVFTRLVDKRGMSAEEAAGALRAAGVATWQQPPVELWSSGEVEAEAHTDGTWSLSVPVWSDGARTSARLRFRVADPYGDGLWEPWLEAVEA